MGTLDQPNEITDVEVLSTSIEPGGMGAIEEVDSADTDVVDESGTDSDIGVVEIDITSELSADQIRDLFAAFSDEDWSEVDRLLNDWEQNGVYTDTKAGGADRNRGGAETLRRYWTVGVGGQKIRWGMPGDWTRCVQQLTEHLGPRAKGYCALRHKEMNGYYPGDKRNKSDIGTNSIYHESKDSAFTKGEPMLEHKTVGVKGMNVVSADEGIVETIISVTGLVDNVKDRIIPGAYAKTLAKRKPKGVWSHDWDTPVSKTLDVKELLPGDPELPDHMPDGDPWPSNAGALKVKTQFNLETQRGREAYSDVVFFGEEQEWSIGYNVPVGGAKVDQKSGVREIETLELYEYSPVLFGAMPLARTTSVKEAQLALKALKGGAAAWLAEAPAETVDNTDEYEAAGSDDIEDQLVDDFEGKDMSLTGDQMILVKRAITTLTDLLDVVQGDVEVKSDMAEASDDEDEDDSDEGDDVQEYDTLVEAIDDIVNDSEIYDALIDPASAIDDALNVDDVEALDQASNEFLDGIQAQMKRDGVDVQLLRDLASTVADLIQQVSGEEGSPEMPSEDTIEKKEPEVEAETTEDVADAEPEPVGAAEGKTILSVEEIESFIKDFNAK